MLRPDDCYSRTELGNLCASYVRHCPSASGTSRTYRVVRYETMHCLHSINFTTFQASWYENETDAILGLGENCVNSWQKLGIILWVCRGQLLCCAMRNAYNPGRTATGGCPYNRRSTPENLKSAISDRARYIKAIVGHVG